ncbi:cytochrome P450 [Leisingera sp. JC1]|uniref:cytochrome P450 n=1 Tax=Leisingera sp. JC1 TaxID=1855282 RepID=UPI000802CC84|nr:cytochrome P450 [Leisingera sp. JC1]OBY26566.1 cytochrome [Leisingera sp. JC1]
MSLDYLNPDALFSDPYPVFARLRQEAPVHFYEGTHEFLVTRYDDCRAVGSNDKVFGPAATEGRPEFRVMGTPNVLTMSGESHQNLRKGIDAIVDQPHVRGYVDQLTRPVVQRFLDELKPKGEANLTTELFEPISVRCIGDALGFTDTPLENLYEWFYAMADGLALGAGAPFPDPQAVWDRLDRTNADINKHFGALYEACLAKPRPQAITNHIIYGGMADGKVRSFEELLPTMRVIFLGGFQEPGHAAANAAAGLLADEGQRNAMLEAPEDLAMKAFDEGLRWIAPIGVTPRVASEDFELNGVRIPAGSTVAIVMASANRDESRFDNPDKFDMFRKKKPHLTFGFRPHFCSGHFLSRAMGEIIMTEVFKQLPNIRLDPEKEVVASGWRFRGVKELHAKWDA